jgi:hypothetical protein
MASLSLISYDFPLSDRREARSHRGFFFGLHVVTAQGRKAWPEEPHTILTLRIKAERADAALRESIEVGYIEAMCSRNVLAALLGASERRKR